MTSRVNVSEPTVVDTGALLLDVHGTLDSETYRHLRDAVVKAALSEPHAVIVDVSRLEVAAPSAWSVFTSARWLVSTWPDIPVMLVCTAQPNRESLGRSGVSRHVPLYRGLDDAVNALDAEEVSETRRRARAELTADPSSIKLSRLLVNDWLVVRWARPMLVPTAATVASVLVENALEHTEGGPVLIVEAYEDVVTVAVEDASREPAQRIEDPVYGADIVSGVSMLHTLCRHWGNSTTSNGKTVWAVIGPENRL